MLNIAVSGWYKQSLVSVHGWPVPFNVDGFNQFTCFVVMLLFGQDVNVMPVNGMVGVL